MSRSFSEKQKGKKGARFQFELLEPRHLFSVNPSATSSPDTPPIEPTSIAPPLGEQADQALTNFTWLPMVFAGADKVASVASSLLLTGEVIVNSTSNLSMQWTKLSGPGNAIFGNASAVSSSVQFDQTGTYELQLAATNGGLTSFDRIFVTVSASNTINIDQAWLNAQGPGPYYLNQEGKTYVLQTDVTTKGTAFAIIAKDITFDLNGHTITYDNAAPIAIPNGSFEQGSGSNATGWNFSNAPSASRYYGEWLHNEIYDGDYSLRFSDTKVNQFVTSTTTITLEPNTTYSLSAMFELGGQGDYSNPGVKGYVRLIGSNGEPIREVSFNKTNWRGIQHQEGVFTTGGTQETYTIQVGIEGNSASTKPYYIDDIKIQRTKNFGIVVSPKSWNAIATPGLTEFGAAANATIKNGALVQGQGNSTWGHGVYIYAEDGVTVDRLNVTVAGANSSALAGNDMSTRWVTLNGNTLTSNVQTITSRDAFNGAVVNGLVGSITNNEIMNGPHAGIFCGGSGPAAIISGNTIRLKVKYTNAFAILGNMSSQVFNNTILSGTGDYTSHGIAAAAGSPAAPSRIYNNTIEVQQLPGINQEYEGIPPSGVFGIQVDESGGTTADSHKEIYGNNVTIRGAEGGYAIRLTDVKTPTRIHNNTLRIEATGYAAAFSFQGTDGRFPLIEDNTVITNGGIAARLTNSPNMILRRTTVQFVAPLQNPHVFYTAWSTQQDVHSTVSMLDTIFADASSRSYMGDATVKVFYPYHTPDNQAIVSIDWTTTIDVKNSTGQAIAGASVSIKDKNNVEVFSGTTDANGRVVTILKQQQMQGSTKTTYDNYTMTINSGGSSHQQTFAADKKQTITLQLGAAQQTLIQSSDESLARQALDTLIVQGIGPAEVGIVTMHKPKPQEVPFAGRATEPAATPNCDTSSMTSDEVAALTIDSETVDINAFDEVYANLEPLLRRSVVVTQIL